MKANESRVYEYVRSRARLGKRPTVRETAEATGVARSTVARAAVSLGYASWSDFTEQLRHYHGSGESVGALAESVEMVVSVLKRHAGETVLIDSVGDVEICLEYMLIRLGELGISAMPYGRGVADAMGDGVLLVLNESGMALFPSCVHAAELGYEIIAITASHDTPISKLAGVNVVIKNNKSSNADYKPNYFTAGVLAYLERVLAEYARGWTDGCDAEIPAQTGVLSAPNT